MVDLRRVALRIRGHQAQAKHLVLLQLPSPRQVVLALAVKAVGDVDAEEAFAAVCSIWMHEARIGDWSPETADKYAQAARRFIDHAAIEGHLSVDEAAQVAEDWLFSGVTVGKAVFDPAIATLHFRRAVLRSFFVTARVLGLTTARPLQDLVLPSRVEVSGRRPVDDGEMALLKETADTQRGQRGPVTLALARCGAGTGEMGDIAADAVDLQARVIDLPGDRRLGPRTVAIATAWDYEVLAEHLATQQPGAALLLSTSRTGHGIQSAMSASLTELMKDARLSERDQVVPNSIRAWAGVRVYEATGDLFVTARFLGLSSLDKTATLIGLNWFTSTSDSSPQNTDCPIDDDEEPKFYGPGLAS